ncbi:MULTISPECIES: DUF7504 family protein [Halorussus]|uniref:DUF7504 family protein n=1 Tax=Halorussus TaxID=1070314 RepID=UPI0020A19E1D|nr:hypothetical protein [Halorussus vallis]USZ77607.1 hypothetical protein NGM07_09780 [Halorussus vallis]
MTPKTDLPDTDREDATDPQIDDFPDAIADGAVVLLAGTVDPATSGLCLRALSQCDDGDGTAVVVTTTEGAAETVRRYRRAYPPEGTPELRLVDAASQQYVSALYRDVPTVSLPRADDLERLVLALSDLTDASVPSAGRRHLVVRSLGPLLESTPASRVSTVLERIAGLRTESGLALFGFDYTAHDEATLNELAAAVDAIVWATRRRDGEIRLKLQSTQSLLHSEGSSGRSVDRRGSEDTWSESQK